MNNKVLIIVVSILIMIAVMMGSGFLILWNKVSPPDPQINIEKEKAEIADKDARRPLHTLDSLIVNLSDGAGNKYLKITIVLELTSEETISEINKRLSQIKDVILMIIPTKKSTYIQTVAGKKGLGDEIMIKLNSILKNGSITNIYFTEFVIQ